MKKKSIDDYELVNQTAEEEKTACGGCCFRYVSNCIIEYDDSCTKNENLDKVWKPKQQENETNN